MVLFKVWLKGFTERGYAGEVGPMHERKNVPTVDSITEHKANNAASVRDLVVISMARMIAVMIIITAILKTVARPIFCLFEI